MGVLELLQYRKQLAIVVSRNSELLEGTKFNYEVICDKKPTANKEPSIDNL